MARYLAIDLGDKRTGLAIGDDITKIVSPAGVEHAPLGPVLLEKLAAAIERQRPGAIVMGLPLNMDGSESHRSGLVRSFAAELEAAVGIEVLFQDERLTSFDADQRMARTGRTHAEKKALRDQLAAMAILEDFLESV